MTTLASTEVIAEQYAVSEQPPPPAGTTRLAREVKEAQAADPLYGPEQDKAKHLVGVEYEVVLEHYLKNVLGKVPIAGLPALQVCIIHRLAAIDIPFESEADLKSQGTSKTPDVLLSSPIGVQVPNATGDAMEWKMICWIDSKVHLQKGLAGTL